jgi:hypothetical protein
MKFPFSPHPCQQLLLVLFLMVAIFETYSLFNPFLTPVTYHVNSQPLAIYYQCANNSFQILWHSIYLFTLPVSHYKHLLLKNKSLSSEFTIPDLLRNYILHIYICIYTDTHIFYKHRNYHFCKSHIVEQLSFHGDVYLLWFIYKLCLQKAHVSKACSLAGASTLWEWLDHELCTQIYGLIHWWNHIIWWSFWEVTEAFWGGAWLEEVNHWGLSLVPATTSRPSLPFCNSEPTLLPHVPAAVMLWFTTYGPEATAMWLWTKPLK